MDAIKENIPHRFPYRWTLKDAKFTKNKGKVFSCFAGGGGSSFGYKLAGFDVIGCNEVDKKMMEAYKENHNPSFIHDYSTSILFHGSPIKINDRYMASETYFTEDIEIAKGYGKFVYSIEMDDKLRTIMQLDCLGEHFISTRLIPMYLFNVQEF